MRRWRADWSQACAPRRTLTGLAGVPLISRFIAAGASEDQRMALFAGNAARFYRIEESLA
jgi:hypothetical protein